MFAASLLGKGVAWALWASSFRAVTLQTPTDQTIRWDLQAQRGSPLVLRLYETYPSKQPDPDRVRMAVVNGMRSWNWAIGNHLPFDLWAGQDEGSFPPRFLPDELNAIFWRSAAMRQRDEIATAMRKSQAAYTAIYFDEVSGEMKGFDMALNDVNFRFVSRQDVALGLAQPPDVKNKELYLEDTVLHELGHVFGLDHSLDPESVLYPIPRRAPGSLGCDDLASVRGLYSQSGVEVSKAANAFELSGVLRSENGVPLPGYGVMAVHRDNPKLRVTASTKAQGRFSFKGMREGSYALYAYPLKPLRRFFVQSQEWGSASVCEDPQNTPELTHAPPQWVSLPSGRVQWMQAQRIGQTAGPGQALELRCSLAKGEAPSVASPRFPVKLHAQAAGPESVWSMSDRFRNRPELLPNAMRHYTWSHPGGPAKIGWLSDAIGSEHSVTLALWRVTENENEPALIQELQPSLEHPGEHQLWQPHLDAGEYLVSVKRSNLREARQGLTGAGAKPWSYFVWVDQHPAVPTCEASPQSWPAYEAPTRWPPNPEGDRGCRILDARQGSLWSVFGLVALGWIRRRRS